VDRLFSSGNGQVGTTENGSGGFVGEYYNKLTFSRRLWAAMLAEFSLTSYEVNSPTPWPFQRLAGGIAVTIIE